MTQPSRCGILRSDEGTAMVGQGRLAAIGAVLVAGMLVGVGAGAQVAEADRIDGASRYATSVAIAQYGFHDPAEVEVVYVARGDVLADALAAGTLAGGPVLLAPRCGDPDPLVISEIERLDPDRVVALGGPGAVCDATLVVAAGGRETDRLAGDSRYGTAIAISRAGFPDGAEVAYVASAADSPDAVAGGSLQGGPILLVPPDGPAPPEVVDEVARLDPAEVIVLGGPGAVDDATAVGAAAGRPVRRLAGTNRGATSVEISQEAFPAGSQVVLVARQDVFPDAVAAGPLDLPVLLVPSCGTVDDVVLGEADRLGADTVVALGGEGAVCDAVLDQFLGVPPVPDPDPTPDPGQEVVRLVHLVTSDQAPQATADAIRNDVGLANGWFADQSGYDGLAFPRDDGGALVVQRLEVDSPGDHFQTAFDVEAALRANGVEGWSLVYVEALGGGACGEYGAQTVAMWVRRDCGGKPSATTSSYPFGSSYLVSHEMTHMLGAARPCAPNAIPGGHVNDDNRDVIYSGTDGRDWNNLMLDPGNDDYFRHDIPDCLDIDDSPLWDR